MTLRRVGSFPGPSEVLSVSQSGTATESDPAADDGDGGGYAGMTWRQRRRKQRQEVGD